MYLGMDSNGNTVDEKNNRILTIVIEAKVFVSSVLKIKPISIPIVINKLATISKTIALFPKLTNPETLKI